MYKPAPGVAPERTGWRDERISRRHRVWGQGISAVDFDFLLLEYTGRKPAAMVEYKAFGAAIPDVNKGVYPALVFVANAARIPLLIAFYDSQQWWFRVRPVNTHARAFLSKEVVLSEVEYVSMLYRMRGQLMPRAVAAQLCVYKPYLPSE